MPVATLPLTGIEEVPILQGGLNKMTSVGAVAALGPSVSGNSVYASLQPGIVTDGITNCRDAVNLLIQTYAGTASTIMIDGPILISTKLDWTQPIILPNDLNIEFTESGRFIADGTGVPTFLAQHWQRSRWRNTQIEYIGDYGDIANDLTANPFHAAVGNVNSITIKADLAARFANTFASGGAGLWTGQTNMSAIFRISGDSRKIYFDGGRMYARDWPAIFSASMLAGVSNIALAAPWAQVSGLWYVTFSNDQTISMILTNGSTATSSWSAVTSAVAAANATAINPSYFIPTAFALDAQWLPTLTNIHDTGVTVVGPTTAAFGTDINFQDFELDGFCMGWVGGSCSGGGTFRRITGKRYSDMQDSFGNNVGGNITNSPNWSAPPHLIYLKSPGAPFTAANKYTFEEMDDQGIYLGSPVRRDVNSGNILSMKIEPAGGTVLRGMRCLRPDGFGDILSSGYSGGACEGIYCELSTYKQWYTSVPATVGIGASDTSFSITVVAPYLTGWPYATGTYTTVFSNGVSRSIVFTNGSSTSGTFTALGTAASSSIVVAIDSITAPGGANWAARYPSGAGLSNFSMDIDIVDKSVIPGGHPLLSDDGTGHTNIRIRSREMIPDYPGTWQPGYIFTGNGNTINATIVYNTCTSPQTSTGACWVKSAIPLIGCDFRYAILGWRQVTLTFTGTLTSATSATLTAPWTPASGAYRVQFSTGAEKMVTFTQGLLTATWSGAITATASANCNLLLTTNFSSLRQRIQVNSALNFGNHIEVIDVSNGMHTIIDAGGYGRERWTQKQIVDSAAGASIASNLSFLSTHSMDSAIFQPIVNFGTTGSLTAIQLGYTGTPTAFQASEPIIINQDSSTPSAAPVSLGSNLTTTRNILLTAASGTFDATGRGILTASATRSFNGQ
jgi:hypothetical protein